RFWTRPGRTSAWWDNFINGTMFEEEWRENFRMSKTSLLKLAEELRPQKRANHHRSRFWTRPGRTSAWWDNFINGTMFEEEWRENFRMSKTSLLKLAEELRPYIEGKETIMRSPVDVVKQVSLTLYYLTDEGRLRKTANAFGVSRQVTSKIIR
ncbi:unnamed protein product, partial [Porites evermanni]